MWKPKRDVYVSWNTVGAWLSVGSKEGRRNEAEKMGRREAKKQKKDVQEAKTARLAAARVRP